MTTVLDVPTRISDLYSSPFDQVAEQIRLAIETVKERQESELINNTDYGLLASVDAGQRLATLAGPPTPDDSRPADHQGLEGAGVLPGPPARHRGLRPRVHAAAACRRPR